MLFTPFTTTRPTYWGSHNIKTLDLSSLHYNMTAPKNIHIFRCNFLTVFAVVSWVLTSLKEGKTKEGTTQLRISHSLITVTA